MRVFNVVLVVVVLASALAVVSVRHRNRTVFVDLQARLAARDRLNEQYGQLLLERATWSLDHVVEKEAARRLGMHVPTVRETEVVVMPVVQ